MVIVLRNAGGNALGQCMIAQIHRCCIAEAEEVSVPARGFMIWPRDCIWLRGDSRGSECEREEGLEMSRVRGGVLFIFFSELRFQAPQAQKPAASFDEEAMLRCQGRFGCRSDGLGERDRTWHFSAHFRRTRDGWLSCFATQAATRWGSA